VLSLPEHEQHLCDGETHNENEHHLEMHGLVAAVLLVHELMLISDLDLNPMSPTEIYPPRSSSPARQPTW